MSEETTAAAQAAAPEQKFSIQRVYLKDLSFETPQGPAAFQKQWQPKVNQDLSTKSAKIEEGLFEVALRLTITVSDGDETIYLVEVEQAGLFAIQGFEDQQMAQIINTTCPNMLFPYARETIDNVLVKGSFPALMIPPINFDALFASAMQQAAAKAKEAESEGEDSTTH
ncbi:MAG: protein-export chaperone SecB [Porticoccaceae bacterium]|jgi:preprotein translocase subunit SecB|nr:protein-export chaperone SecB [Porticoccaceae bacterium]MBT5577457.1 protein-export chaperone SecB [Porticoccaceae bacterium]MBT7375093.1 protein-export chaperone SecB [Porticoccaceae bacterium]